jgi:transposase
MGKPYSQDLRNRIVDYIASGHSARAAGRVFGVSASTAVRLAASFRRGEDTRAKPQGRSPGTIGKLATHTGFLLEVVQSDPDITLAELAGALEEAEGVKVNVSSIHRALKRAGLSYKKRPDRQRA